MFMLVLLTVAAAFVSFAAQWRVYQKMGMQGWKSLIPMYSQFLLFKAVYGNGWVVLKLWLMPVFNMLATFVVTFICSMLRTYDLMMLLTILIMLISAYIAIKTMIKLWVDLAHLFGQPTSFGFGLLLVRPIFMILLAFSNLTYQDGSKNLTEADAISAIIYKLDAFFRGRGRKNDGKETLTLLRELKELHQDGIVDDNVFQAKKEELLKRL